MLWTETRMVPCSDKSPSQLRLMQIHSSYQCIIQQTQKAKVQLNTVKAIKQVLCVKRAAKERYKMKTYLAARDAVEGTVLHFVNFKHGPIRPHKGVFAFWIP